MKLRLCSIFLCFAAVLGATEVTKLSNDLGYLRVPALGEATKPLRGREALVLDLRHTTFEPSAAEDFAAALRARPADARLYVLVGPETPAELAAILAAVPTPLVTLGVAQSRPPARIVIAQSDAEDARAYAAAETGTPLEQLISGKVEKDHFDEAALVREFHNGNHDARPEQGDPDAAAKPATQPLDRVLQRAAQLHRALQALRR